MNNEIKYWRNIVESVQLADNQKIIKNPFQITKIKSIDPEIWANTQVKKAIIKYILEGIQSSDPWTTLGPERELKTIHVFDTLEKHHCPWPELSILETHINQLVEKIDVHYLDRYARDVLKTRWPRAESKIMKSDFYAMYYARDVIKGPWPEAEPVILKSKTHAKEYKEFVKQLNNDSVS